MVQRLAAEDCKKYHSTAGSRVTEKMSFQYPYRAVVCGLECNVIGWRENKLITNKGRFTVEHIYGNWQIQTCRIFEVATVQSDGKDGWLVNGRPLSALGRISMGARLYSISKDEDLRVHKDRICAAAWVETGSAPNILELLDEIVKFWKTAALPPVNSNKEPHWSELISVAASGFFDASKYHELFPTWSKPLWLAKFRPASRNGIIPIRTEILPAMPANVTVEVIAETKPEIPPPPQPVALIESPKKPIPLPAHNTSSPQPIAFIEPPKPLPDYFTSIDAAAKYIGVTGRTVINWKKRGWLKVEQNGKKIRMARTDLEKCKNRQ